MDFFDTDNVKSKKSNAMQKYLLFRKISNFFFFIVVCLSMILFYWFSTHLRIVFKISYEYFHDLYIILASRLFVFIIGNSIILTLFANSGKFSSKNSTQNSSETDLYEEFIKNSEKHQKIRSFKKEPIVLEDKHTVCEGNSIAVTVKESDSKTYRRIQSEKLKDSKSVKELRRSKTEKSRKSDISGKKVEGKMSFSVEEMSNDEFRRMLDEYIANEQKRLLVEESMAIVLRN